MVFHWSLSDSNTPQISCTFLRILSDFNGVIWIVSTRPIISKSFSSIICFFGYFTKLANYSWYHRHSHYP